MQVGRPLLAAKSAEEFEQALARTLDDPEYPAHVAEIVRLAMDLDLTRLPAELDGSIERYVAYFGEEQRWRVRQTFDMFLEIADRSATLIVPRLDADEHRLQDELNAIFAHARESLPLEPALVSMACNLAAASALLEENSAIPIEVRAALMSRWFTSTQSMLAALDPIQADLDGFLNENRGEFGQVERLAYSRRMSAEGQPSIIVWFVLEDDSPSSHDVDLITDSRLKSRIKALLTPSEPDLDWVSLRVRSASEPGPAEELLAHES